MIFFLLQELVFHFVVVTEEDHLTVDQGFESVSLEAHVCKDYEVVQHLFVAAGDMELSFFEVFG